MLKNSPFILFSALLLSLSCLHAQVLTFEQARSEADSGDARAQAVVAMHYSLGWEVSKNPQKAVEYALKSARSGEALGLFRMGTLLRNGEGVPQNEEEGLKLQLEAVKLWNNQQSDRLEAGDPYCLAAAGILIFQGKVVDDTQQNRYNTAAQLYRKAAEAGLAPAQYNYAMCLIEGHGVDKNSEEAVKYIVMSAMSNYPLSIKWLQDKNSDIPSATNWLKEKGISLENKAEIIANNTSLGSNTTNTNEAQVEAPKIKSQQSNFSQASNKYDFLSFQENKQKADAGDPRAQAIVSWHYDLGWQIDKNPSQALIYAKKSAEQGYPIGLARLGILYSDKGGYNNINEGQNLKKKSIAGIIQLANSADPYALTILARMIFDGESIPRPGALVLTPQQESNLVIAEQNKPKALELFKLAADMGFAPAQHQFALYKLEGIECEKNIDEFVKYASMAKSLGFKASEDILAAHKNVSSVKTDILNVSNITDLFVKLPSMVEDAKLLDKTSLAPIDTEIIKSIDGSFFTERVTKSDYLKYFAEQFKNQSLPTVKDLKQNATLYQLAIECVNLPYLNEEQKSKLRSELENENTQYIYSAPPYCASGSGDQGAWLSFASGLMLLDSSGAPAFIPREIIMSANLFSLQGKENHYGGFDDVKSLIIQTKNKELFMFPPHPSFHGLITRLGPGDKNPIQALASAFNYHKFLINASILQNYVDQTKTKVDRNAPGILNYSGISLGMDKSRCEEILRELIDYKVFNSLRSVRCDNFNDLSDRNVSDSIRVLTDFQVASNGLLVVPPWEMLIVQPKEPIDNERRGTASLKPLDVFLFKNNILVFVARYPNFHGSNEMFDDDDLDGDKSPKDNSQLKAFLEKYGQQPLLISSMFEHNSYTPRVFQIIWKDNDSRVGAVFNFHGRFKSLPHNLKPPDRVRNTNNGTKIRNYGSLVPIDAEELDFSTNDKSSLRASFYWSEDSALLINKTSEEHINKMLEKNNQLQKQQSQKLRDEI